MHGTGGSLLLFAVDVLLDFGGKVTVVMVIGRVVVVLIRVVLVVALYVALVEGWVVKVVFVV